MERAKDGFVTKSEQSIGNEAEPVLGLRSGICESVAWRNLLMVVEKVRSRSRWTGLSGEVIS